jgi:excisionase family DNA binding protein
MALRAPLTCAEPRHRGRVLLVEEDTYTPAEAARILRLSKRRIIQLITEGDLEGDKDEDGRWRIPQRAVHDRLGDRPPRRGGGAGGEGGGASGALDYPAPGRTTQDLEAEISDLNYRLGAAETRAALTELSESTVREQLERERERADRLEEELREERSKGFWQRLFGG